MISPTAAIVMVSVRRGALEFAEGSTLTELRESCDEWEFVTEALRHAQRKQGVSRARAKIKRCDLNIFNPMIVLTVKHFAPFQRVKVA